MVDPRARASRAGVVSMPLHALVTRSGDTAILRCTVVGVLESSPSLALLEVMRYVVVGTAQKESTSHLPRSWGAADGRQCLKMCWYGLITWIELMTARSRLASCKMHVAQGQHTPYVEQDLDCQGDTLTRCGFFLSQFQPSQLVSTQSK